MSKNRIDSDFRLLEAAAVAGERCPQNQPFGPIHSYSIRTLVNAKRIRSETYGLNWRRVVILEGPHKGKATAPPPNGGAPYLVNGVLVKRIADRQQATREPWKPGTKIAP